MGDLKNESTKVTVAAETAPEINYRGIKAMPFIIGNETFEKLGTIGTSTNLLVYLKTVFNMKSVSATTLITTFNGTTNLAPLVGAFLSDTYFGRYITLGFASICSFIGMCIIMLTAAISKLHPPHCPHKHITDECTGPTPWQMAFLLTGFGFLVVGAGGIRSCNLAFGADQFNPNNESGKRGINSFFNWYYFTFTFAMMVSVTIIVYVQTNINWAIGLAIPTFLMFLSVALYFIGSPIYVKVKPQGSPFSSMAQVLVASFKKRRLEPPANPEFSLFNHHPPVSVNSKLPYSYQFRCLDKAAIITSRDEISPDGSASNPWALCRLQQVEELKCVVRVMPIWASGILFYVTIVQQHTYGVLQAVQSDRTLSHKHTFTIPAASYAVFTMLALTIWIPIYDRLVVPTLRRITHKEGGITMLQRIGVGMAISVATMLVSALVEKKRKNVAFSGNGPMSALWLVPQLVLAGLSEAFAAVGQVEFYYKQFPENMRSVAGALFFVTMAGANYLSGLMVSIVHKSGNWLAEDLNKGRLELYYFVIMGMGALNFGYFLVCARWYRYKECWSGGGGVGGVEMELSKQINGHDQKHV